MQVAVCHRVSGNLLGKFEVDEEIKVWQKFVDSNPDYDCDTVKDFLDTYPELAQSLVSVVLH